MWMGGGVAGVDCCQPHRDTRAVRPDAVTMPVSHRARQPRHAGLRSGLPRRGAVSSRLQRPSPGKPSASSYVERRAVRLSARLRSAPAMSSTTRRRPGSSPRWSCVRPRPERGCADSSRGRASCPGRDTATGGDCGARITDDTEVETLNCGHDAPDRWLRALARAL